MKGRKDMKDVLKEAIQTFGVDAQLDMCIEEMSELQKEICKKKRGKDNREAIIEEIADVYIVLRQLEMMCDITLAEVAEMQMFKLERLKERIQDVKKVDRVSD